MAIFYIITGISFLGLYYALNNQKQNITIPNKSDFVVTLNTNEGYSKTFTGKESWKQTVYNETDLTSTKLKYQIDLSSFPYIVTNEISEVVMVLDKPFKLESPYYIFKGNIYSEELPVLVNFVYTLPKELPDIK